MCDSAPVWMSNAKTPVAFSSTIEYRSITGSAVLTAHSRRRAGSTAIPNTIHRPSRPLVTKSWMAPDGSMRTILRLYWLLTKKARVAGS